MTRRHGDAETRGRAVWEYGDKGVWGKVQVRRRGNIELVVVIPDAARPRSGIQVLSLMFEV